MSWDLLFEAHLTLTAGAGALQQSRKESFDFGFLDDVLSRACGAAGATSALIAARGEHGLLEVVGRFAVEWPGLEQPRFLDNLPANELDKEAFFSLGHTLIQRDSCPLLLRALGGRRASTALLLPLFYCLSDANRVQTDRVSDEQVAKSDGLMCFFFEESVRLADMTSRVSAPSSLTRLEFLKKLAQAVGVACAAAFRETDHCVCCRTGRQRKRHRASASACIPSLQEDGDTAKSPVRIGAQLDKLAGIGTSIPHAHPGASGTERLLEYSECLHALHGIVNDPNWNRLSLSDKVGRILRLGVNTFGMTRGVVCKVVGNDVIFRHVYVSPDEKAASTPMFQVGLKGLVTQMFQQYVQESDGPVGFYHAGSNVTLSSKICHTMMEIESWIGTKLLVDGEQYGQLCFASVEPKRPLDERDLELARVLAQTVGNEMSRARANRLLEEQRNKADLANSTKTAFMSVLSHEIRTPMNGVVGMAQLLAVSQLDHHQHECVDTILASATSLLTIINDLLDVNKAEAGKMTVVAQPMNLAEMIKSTLDTVAPLCTPKGLQLVASVSPDVPTVVQSDCVRVKQILINFLSNAIKFSTNGIVHLSVEAKPLDGSKKAERCWVSMDGRRMDVDTQGSSEPDPDAARHQHQRCADISDRLSPPPSPARKSAPVHACGGAEASARPGSAWGGANPYGSGGPHSNCGEVELRFAVTDEGEGIPVDRQAQIFQLYSQVDKSHQRRTGGTGLGLVICKQLAELMGGSVGFCSQPGVGSTFWATVCAAVCDDEIASADTSRAEFPRASPSLNRSGLQILLIDKHAGRRHLVAQALDAWAHSAGSGPARCWKVTGVEAVESVVDALGQLTSVGGWVAGDGGRAGGDVTTIALWFRDVAASLDADGFSSSQLAHLQRVAGVITHLMEIYVRPAPFPTLGLHDGISSSANLATPCLSYTPAFNPVLESISPFSHLFRWHEVLTGPLVLPYLCARLELHAPAFRQHLLIHPATVRELDLAPCSPCHPSGSSAMDFAFPEYSTVTSCNASADTGGGVTSSGGLQLLGGATSGGGGGGVKFSAVASAMANSQGLDAGSPMWAHGQGVREAAGVSAKSCRVLLVEDNPVNVRVAMMMLSRLNCCIDVANDGQAAVDRYVASCTHKGISSSGGDSSPFLNGGSSFLSRNTDDVLSGANSDLYSNLPSCNGGVCKSAYDLVFMDVQMPIMDGMEATGSIRRFEVQRGLPPVPVIAMTANASTEDMQACVDAGMNGFIAKPIMLPTLQSVMERTLGRQVQPVIGSELGGA
eukprot:jgi/Mesvir1/25559/Mv01796-RA.1